MIKECLVEILAEGIGPSSSPKKSTPKKRKTPARRRPAPQDINPVFNEAVSRSTSTLTSDPVMAAIFEDTARTTLQEQRESPSAMSAIPSPGAETTADGEPEDLFEGSQNWAALAFSDDKK